MIGTIQASLSFIGFVIMDSQVYLQVEVLVQVELKVTSNMKQHYAEVFIAMCMCMHCIVQIKI